MDSAPPGCETPLQTSLNAISMILQRKMFSESKDEIALVLFSTDNTANDLADGSSYENVMLARPLGKTDWDLLQYVKTEIAAGSQSADFIDAFIVAVDHLVKATKGKRGISGKRLILFSNLAGEFGDDKIDEVIAGMKAENVELSVIGPDLPDADDDDIDEDGGGGGEPSNGTGDHSKSKTPQQIAGERMIRHILKQVEGDSYSFSEALPALSFFQTRQVKQTAWKCQLDIAGQLKIPVCAYTKVTEAKVKSMKDVYAKDADAEIQKERTFHLNDEAETEVEADDTVQGHRYGSTLVPFSKEDAENMKYTAEKCLSVLGFTKSSQIRRHHFIGTNVMVVCADKGDEVAGVALSALIHALYETSFTAIVRRVYANRSAPKLGFLTPQIKPTRECLIYSELPFMEDVRQFTFGSLPISDDIPDAVKKHQPSDNQLSAMDKLIDEMDLTQVVADEDDGEKTEAFKPKLTFNPYIQRLYQCLQHRVENPDDPLPELNPLVANYLKRPQEVTTNCERTIDEMKTLFPLEVIVQKKQDENVFQNDQMDNGPTAKKPKLDNDADVIAGSMADIPKMKITEVGTVTPVQDFLNLIGQKDQDNFTEACKMMQKQIIQIVLSSFGSQSYQKAFDCVRALREQCAKNSEVDFFNRFLREMKDTMADKNRKDFWDKIVSDKLTLISHSECAESNVSETDAVNFLKADVAKPELTEPEPSADDADDLLDMM
ncbi:X-ray repair cross-complementing protein 5-like isoform X2 [Tubulanus polymorphus]|uniref:X-ray repair cross-complementing protein 5-like isoform X2 n=1 Tax=Tubulanus polymorphus TaxID=672921 RepID=UPI003DA23EE2